MPQGASELVSRLGYDRTRKGAALHADGNVRGVRMDAELLLFTSWA